MMTVRIIKASAKLMRFQAECQHCESQIEYSEEDVEIVEGPYPPDNQFTDYQAGPPPTHREVLCPCGHRTRLHNERRVDKFGS